MGQVLQGGAGQAPARQAAVGAGLPIEVPADTINKVCASSIRAVEIADQMIRAGDHSVIVAGGMESMSNAPYALQEGAVRLQARRRRAGRPDGPRRADVDLRRPAHGRAGVVRLARARDHARGPGRVGAPLARARGRGAWTRGASHDEIVPVGDVTVDEGPRRDTTLEKLASLRPVFDPEGTTTAGNAPGVNDGAGALVVTSEEFARKRGLEVLATIVSQGYVADEFAYLARTPAGAGTDGAGQGRQEDRRREARRGERGVLLRRAQLDADAGRRPGDGERERRRSRARPSDRRVGRQDPRRR